MHDQQKWNDQVDQGNGVGIQQVQERKKRIQKK